MDDINKLVTLPMLEEFKKQHDELFDSENIQKEIDKVLEKEGFLTEEFVTHHFYDKTTVDRMLSDLDHIKIEIVDELPDHAIDPNAIYLIRNGTSNIYEQYIYSEDTWFDLGNTSIDLSNFYNMKQVDEKLQEIADEVNILAGEDHSIILDDKVTQDSHNGVKSSGIYEHVDHVVADAFADVDFSDFVTKEETDKAIEDKVDEELVLALADFYNKSSADRKFALKDDIKETDLSSYNTKTEVDNKILAAKQELQALIKTGITTEVVNSLPTSNISASTIYLTKNNDTNTYEQHMYINNSWYILGSTDLDLTGYVKEEQLSKYAKAEDLGIIPLSAAAGNIIERKSDGYYVNAVTSGSVNITSGDISKAKYNTISLKPDGLFCDGVSEEELTELDMSVFPTNEQIDDFNTLINGRYSQFEADCVTELGKFNDVKTGMETWGQNYRDNLNAEKYVKQGDLVELDMAIFPTHEQIDDFNNTVTKKLEDWEANTEDKLAEYNEIKNSIQHFTEGYEDRLNAEKYVKQEDLVYLDLDWFPSSETVVEFNQLTNERYQQWEDDCVSKMGEFNDVKAAMETYATNYKQNLDDEKYVKQEDLVYLDLEYFPNQTIIAEFNQLTNERYDKFDADCAATATNIQKYCDDTSADIKKYCDDYKTKFNTDYTNQFNDVKDYCDTYEGKLVEYRANLDAEKYVKQEDLVALDFSELYDRIEALEAEVRALKGEEV